MTTTAHILSTMAIQADARFSATIDARTNGKRNRWTMTPADMLIPEIRDAYTKKINADDAWWTFLRVSAK